MKELVAAFMIALLFSVLFVATHFGVVQAATMWSQTFGGTGDEIANSLVVTSDGRFAIAGSNASNGDVWWVGLGLHFSLSLSQTYLLTC